MKTILAIAQLTYKEGVHHKVLYGIILFSFMLIAMAVLGSGFFMRNISKVTLDICLSGVTFGGLLVPFFFAINLISGDIEKKTLFTILSRHISRGQYILGKFFGLLLLTAVIMLILSFTTVVAVEVGKYVFSADYFTTYSLPSVILSIVASFLGVTLLISCVILWSCITTSPFLATLLSIATYVIGQTSEDIVRFLSLQSHGATFSPIFKKTIIVAQYIFPNFSSFDLKLQAAHGVLISSHHIFFLLLYTIMYVTIILTMTIIFFSKRDLA